MENCRFFSFTGEKDQSAKAVYTHLQQKHGIKGVEPGSATAKKAEKEDADEMVLYFQIQQ